MKKLALFSSLFFVFAPAASAVQINSRVVDSVQLTVAGPSVQTERTGSSYSVSGSNINVTTLGGLTRPIQITRELDTGVNTDPMDIRQGDYAVAENGSAFAFSETAYVGDRPITDQIDLTNNGRFNTPVLYGQSTTSVGGTHGDLSGTLHVGGVPSVTAGGVGTTAIGQRTIELSVFR